MYDSIQAIIHHLKALDVILTKTEAHIEAKKIDPNAILTFRLFPDMFTFTRQVQLTTDFAKGCAARLAGQAVPSYADEETTFADLHARIAKTIAFASAIDAAAFKGAEARSVTVRVGRNEEKTMPGSEYFNRMALPNFYFHLATAYNILRHNGVELGKNDFLGRSL
jgi:uncharacterized protein